MSYNVDAAPGRNQSPRGGIGWTQTLGSALVMAAGGWIAWTAMREPASQLGAETQPRVQ